MIIATAISGICAVATLAAVVVATGSLLMPVGITLAAITLAGGL